MYSILFISGNEAREITQKDKTDHGKISSSIKSHEEILELFKEIETIEENIQNFDSDVDAPLYSDDVPLEERDIDLEQQPEINSPPIDKPTQKTHHTLFHRHKKKKIKKPTSHRHFFKKIKAKRNIKKDDELTQLQKQKKKSKNKLDRNSSTFTLKITDNGDLVGLNIKKHPLPQEHKGLKNLFSKKEGSKKQDTEKSEVKGLKAIPVKIKAIFSSITKRRSGKDAGESSTSKISGISGKIKGIFSRKSK